MDRIGAARTAYTGTGFLGSDALGTLALVLLIVAVAALGVALYMLIKSERGPFLKGKKKVPHAPHSAHPRPPHHR